MSLGGSGRGRGWPEGVALFVFSELFSELLGVFGDFSEVAMARELRVVAQVLKVGRFGRRVRRRFMDVVYLLIPSNMVMDELRVVNQCVSVVVTEEICSLAKVQVGLIVRLA